MHNADNGHYRFSVREGVSRIGGMPGKRRGSNGSGMMTAHTIGKQETAIFGHLRLL